MSGVARHSVERVRHELKRRTLSVARVEPVTPKLLRVTLTGPDLEGFTSLGHDDHVKLFFPDPARPDAPPAMRDYTPRRYDAARQELQIEFVLHGEGPAAAWAAQAQPGQRLEIGGPRGSFVVSADFDAYVLAGDETAWPAIARRLEELPAGAKAFVVAEVEDASEEQRVDSRADVRISWVHRKGAEPGTGDALAQAVRALELPPGDVYLWAAGESGVMRRLRLAFVERGAPKEWIKAAGYWKRGAVACHETIED